VGADRALVLVGSLRLTVPLSELGVSRAPARSASTIRPSYQIELSSSAEGAGRTASAELDSRGMRLAEALEVLRKQIDAASLSGLGTFSVIHGTGEGILAKGIHEWLKSQPPVADYYFARPEDGGFGKTWVQLKA
jgi:DNA mismatch repair protein MutS2